MLNLDALPRPSARRIAPARHAGGRARAARRPPLSSTSPSAAAGHAGQPGDLAVIFDARRRFLAIGLYDQCLRRSSSPGVLQHHTPPPLTATGSLRIPATAAGIRDPLAADGTDGYRLVHGENDGLPGLVVDRYAGTLVLKLYTAAWLPHLAGILAALADVQPAGATPPVLHRSGHGGLGVRVPAERVVLRYSRNLDALMTPHGLSDGQVLSGAELNGPIVFRGKWPHLAADGARPQDRLLSRPAREPGNVRALARAGRFQCPAPLCHPRQVRGAGQREPPPLTHSATLRGASAKHGAGRTGRAAGAGPVRA